MKTIFVERELFDLKTDKSVGLISGLKKLTQHSFKIFSKDVNTFEPKLIQILKLENIKVSEVNQQENKNIFEILTKGKSDNDKVVIGKSKIKSFENAVDKIVEKKRSAEVKRKTKETDININLSLDGEGRAKIETRIGFFDHMLEQIARHANLNLTIRVKGDLKVDEHHTVEDTGIALGEAIKAALGDKKGISRYGFFIPMDESVAVCTIDLGGRNYLNFNCKFAREYVGKFPTELTKEFFRGLATGMLANIYISAKGENDHHKIEAIFKSFAKALNQACRIDERSRDTLPTTKGLL